MTNFEALWTGRYPCLCSGEWKLYRNGIDVSRFIPDSLRYSEMGTRKVYSHLYLDNEWDEYVEYYWNGLSAKQWIKKNRFWIKALCMNREEEFKLYHAINDADWRHGSCGGCIY